MKPVAKKVNRREKLLPVKNEPCFGRKAILSGRCPFGDRGRGRVGSEIELCSSTFLRGVPHPKSPLTETVTLVETEDSHSMMEVDKAVTQTAPVAESRLEPTPTREQTALGRRSATNATGIQLWYSFGCHRYTDAVDFVLLSPRRHRRKFRILY